MTPNALHNGATPRSASARAAEDGALTTEPWWRHGMVWLIIGGPLAVVIAGIATAVIAWKGADEVIVDRAASPSVLQKGQGPDSYTPAMQARNHAATAGARSLESDAAAQSAQPAPATGGAGAR